jgi:N-acetylglutamate synthase-like GNAT family acetyltransferase
MTTEPINIRQADSGDITVLSSLIRDSFRTVAERFNLTSENCPKHPSNCTDDWVQNDVARGVEYYILEHNGTPTGCAALEKAAPDLSYLERLAVLPEMREKGFGKTLVNYVFDQAKASDAGKIGIGIISDDIELKEWYREIGFVEGETKEFSHLPFMVTFMTYEL